jgi:RNA polymerase sigma-70 factor (ECF subfamily)
MSLVHIEQVRRRGRASPRPAAKTQASLERQSQQRQDLVTTVVKLRTFSILLCMNVDFADRLVEETLLRASASMSPAGLGSNTLAWLCARLRSAFYHEYAKSTAAGTRHRVELPRLETEASNSLLPALAGLPAEHREALVLVEAAGFSVEAAARICRCSPQTFQLRLDHARLLLRYALSARHLTTVVGAPGLSVGPIGHSI